MPAPGATPQHLHKEYHGAQRTLSVNRRLVQGCLVDVASGLPYTGPYRSVDAKGQYQDGLEQGVWLTYLPGAHAPYAEREVLQYQQGQRQWRVQYANNAWQRSERYEHDRVVDVYQASEDGTATTHNGVRLAADDANQTDEFKIDFKK